MRSAFIASIFALAASTVLAAPAKREFHNRAAKLSWYAGYMMDERYCGGAPPSDDDMVVATSFDMPYKCGDKLTFEYYGNHATVTVRDRCETCHGEWFDLSKGAFAALTDLEVGVLENVDYWSH